MTESRSVLVPAKIRPKAAKAMDAARGSQGRSGFISDLIERHVPGAAPDAEEAVAAPAPAAEPEPVVDLMAALRDSVDQAKATAKERRKPDAEVVPITEGRTRKPAAKPKADKTPSSPATRKADSKAPATGVQEPCAGGAHPKDKLRVLGYATFCGACGHKVR